MDDDHVQIHVVRMGICELLVLQTKSEAEKLRLLIREKRGRVGPLFRPDGWEGRTGFFNYSRRLLSTLLRDHPIYSALEGPSRTGSARPCP